MSAHVEILLRDVAADLVELGELSLDDRIAHAIRLIESRAALPVVRRAVRCAVFSRSAIFHLGAAVVPTSDGEAQQFREQARGGFLQLDTPQRPHVVLSVGEFVLDCAHSAAWHDRGVWLRPFVSRTTSPTWVTDGLPFGVQVAYELVHAEGTGVVAA